MTGESRRMAALAAAALGLMGMSGCARTSPQPVSGADVAAPAQVAPAPSAISFIVNFRPSHALGRAQSLQHAGRYDEAEQLVAVILRDDAAFWGLCFDRFTVGGDEIVLNVCAPSFWEEHLVTQRRWFEHLGGTPGVAYVERNLVAHSTPAGSS
jgi:hypothetical protein